MAGESLDPEMGGVLVYIGGCNKNLEALDDMYYLLTGLSRKVDRDERRSEKLSLRKQLKLKCQEQQTVSPAYEKTPFGAEHDSTIYQPMPISSYMPSGRQNFYLNEYQTPFGKRSFQAKVTKSFPDGYTIETIIDGKPLRGVLFSNKPSSTSMGVNNLNRKTETMKTDAPNMHVDHNSGVESEKSVKHHTNDAKPADAVQNEKEGAEAQVAIAASELKNLATESSMHQEVPGASKSHLAPDINAGNSAANNPLSFDAEMHEENVSAVGKDQNTPMIE